MPFYDLQSFLGCLEREGLLRRVKVEVDPELEIGEIATRVVREEGPALLFERVRGSSYPLAINILGSGRRIEMVLGMHPQQLGERLANFVERLNPPSPKKLWRSRGFLSRVWATRPRRVKNALCREVAEDAPDLNSLPIIKCWPQDGGPFITFPLVITQDPETGRSNVGIYRMQLYDGTRTGMHMQIQKGGGFHHYKAEKQGQPLELAAVLGADPALMLSGILPLPEGFEEVAFSGLLRGGRTPMTKAKTLSLEVPACAEFVLEGVVPPHERLPEGPFGDHFGHYSDVADFPVFHVKAITRRRNPIYPAAVVGKPPQEDRYMGDAAQEIMKPLIRLLRPEVRDTWAYFETGFHNLFVVAVEGRYTKEPIKTALGLLGEGQLGLTKCVILVEPSVDVRRFPQVLRAIRRNFTTQDDFVLISRAPLDTLDFTSFKMHLGSKMIIDATGGGSAPEAQPHLQVDPQGICPQVLKWRLWEDTLLAVQVKEEGREALSILLASERLAGIKIIAAVSPDVDLEDDVSLLWGIFTRFDPARDIIFSRMSLRGALPVYEGTMGIDATFKKGYPAPLEMSEEIRERVSRRWDEYWQ